jgi:hypothetical protein
MTRRQKPAPLPDTGPDIDDSVDYDLDDRLHRFAEMLELAEKLTEELRNGATVETEADADATFDEARDLIELLGKLLPRRRP